ncbi:hypothetical protein HDE_01779 [Halotydeus destructor]|nr:hypothetical protein HDE_01779 [Halotydeus destructor]
MAGLVWLVLVSGLVGLSSERNKTPLLILSIEEVGPLFRPSRILKGSIHDHQVAGWNSTNIFGKEEPLWVTATKQGKAAGIFAYLAPDEKSNQSIASRTVNIDGVKVEISSELQQVYDWLTKKPVKDLVVAYFRNVDTSGVRDDKQIRRLALVQGAISDLLDNLSQIGSLDQINIMVEGVSSESWLGFDLPSEILTGSGTVVFTSGPGFKKAQTESDPYLVACNLLNIEPIINVSESESSEMNSLVTVSRSFPAIPTLAIVGTIILSLVGYCQWRAVQGHDGYEDFKNATPSTSREPPSGDGSAQQTDA